MEEKFLKMPSLNAYFTSLSCWKVREIFGTFCNLYLYFYFYVTNLNFFTFLNDKISKGIHNCKAARLYSNANNTILVFMFLWVFNEKLWQKEGKFFQVDGMPLCSTKSMFPETENTRIMTALNCRSLLHPTLLYEKVREGEMNEIHGPLELSTYNDLQDNMQATNEEEDKKPSVNKEMKLTIVEREKFGNIIPCVWAFKNSTISEKRSLFFTERETKFCEESDSPKKKRLHSRHLRRNFENENEDNLYHSDSVESSLNWEKIEDLLEKQYETQLELLKIVGSKEFRDELRNVIKNSSFMQGVISTVKQIQERFDEAEDYFEDFIRNSQFSKKEKEDEVAQDHPEVMNEEKNSTERKLSPQMHQKQKIIEEAYAQIKELFPGNSIPEAIKEQLGIMGISSKIQSLENYVANFPAEGLNPKYGIDFIEESKAKIEYEAREIIKDILEEKSDFLDDVSHLSDKKIFFNLLKASTAQNFAFPSYQNLYFGDDTLTNHQQAWNLYSQILENNNFREYTIANYTFSEVLKIESSPEFQKIMKSLIQSSPIENFLIKILSNEDFRKFLVNIIQMENISSLHKMVLVSSYPKVRLFWQIIEEHGNLEEIKKVLKLFGYESILKTLIANPNGTMKVVREFFESGRMKTFIKENLSGYVSEKLLNKLKELGVYLKKYCKKADYEKNDYTAENKKGDNEESEDKKEGSEDEDKKEGSEDEDKEGSEGEDKKDESEDENKKGEEYEETEEINEGSSSNPLIEHEEIFEELAEEFLEYWLGKKLDNFYGASGIGIEVDKKKEKGRDNLEGYHNPEGNIERKLEAYTEGNLPDLSIPVDDTIAGKTPLDIFLETLSSSAGSLSNPAYLPTLNQPMTEGISQNIKEKNSSLHKPTSSSPEKQSNLSAKTSFRTPAIPAPSTTITHPSTVPNPYSNMQNRPTPVASPPQTAVNSMPQTAANSPPQTAVNSPPQTSVNSTPQVAVDSPPETTDEQNLSQAPPVNDPLKPSSNSNGSTQGYPKSSKYDNLIYVNPGYFMSPPREQFGPESSTFSPYPVNKEYPYFFPVGANPKDSFQKPYQAYQNETSLIHPYIEKKIPYLPYSPGHQPYTVPRIPIEFRYQEAAKSNRLPQNFTGIPPVDLPNSPKITAMPLSYNPSVVTRPIYYDPWMDQSFPPKRIPYVATNPYTYESDVHKMYPYDTDYAIYFPYSTEEEDKDRNILNAGILDRTNIRDRFNLSGNLLMAE